VPVILILLAILLCLSSFFACHPSLLVIFLGLSS
jgi:hypothetical protein